MSRSAALLASALAFSTPALAENPTPAMDLSKMETVLPKDNPALSAIMTVATAKVASLGLPLALAAGDRPGEIVYKGVPNDKTKIVMDAVNDTPQMNGMGCVSFIVTPDTNLPPADYKGPFDMGAYCGPNIPM